MSCIECKRIKVNEERAKIRELATKIAKTDNKTQIIIEVEGNLSIECEECWIRGGRIGTPIEYIIV